MLYSITHCCIVSPFAVIPANYRLGGIFDLESSFHALLDPGFRRGDDIGCIDKFCKQTLGLLISPFAALRSK
ncbi:MAG: hypothetical protein WCA08_14170 [Desulfoferrobacter sp.]